MIYLSASNNNCAFLFFVYLLQFIKPVSKVKKNTQAFLSARSGMYQTAAASNKEGKKDPETTKETVVHPFLVVCNKLSCQYH